MNQPNRTYYFAGSIRAGRVDVSLYERIISHLKRTGDVLTEHVGDYRLSLAGQTELTDRFIHDRDLSWLRRADCVVAETTRPSLGVGFEIAMAATYQIPVIALHRPAQMSLSAMIGGSPVVQVLEYDDLDEVLHRLSGVLDQRLEGAA
ncbi:MAG: nucleoside 2-deoxyribosyltransferase [Nocardioides sp.]